MTTIDIILFCYHQEQYIEQALQSIYDQQVPKDCSVRIIVADDCSPDNTLTLIEKHAAESPFPMTFLPKEPNMGISKNYKRSFAATTADIVFILEGDDYWLPNHLIQHIAFWQKYPECSLAMSRITALIEQKDGSWSMPDGRWLYLTDPYFVDVHKQIAEGNQLGNLTACSFKGQYLRELPASLFELPIADWMLGVMLVQRGKIALLGDTSSVYRVKASGVWAGHNRWKQHKIMLKDANMYNNYQNKKYNAEWKEFKRSLWQNVRHSWMHYLPQSLQDFIHFFTHRNRK